MEWRPQPKISKKIRSNKMQLEMLVDYMKDHKSFANGEYRGPLGSRKFLQQWEDLRVILSQYGPNKSLEQWRHTWRDLKKKARDEAAQIRPTRTVSGNLSWMPKMSETSAKIMSIIGRDNTDYLKSTKSDTSRDTTWQQTASPNRRVALPLGSPEDCLNHASQNKLEEDANFHDEELLENHDNRNNAVEEELGPKLERLNSSIKTSESMKIAIIPEGFPAEQFDDGWAAFVPIMFSKLEESPELPGVDVEGIIAGAIHVSCKKGTDVAWVYDTFNGSTIGGRKVKVLNLKDLPKPIEMVWETRNNVITDNNRVLKLMQRAHPILRTTEWKVLESNVVDGRVRRVVIMDRISADYIKEQGYKLSNGMCTDAFELPEDLIAYSNRTATSREQTEENLLEKSNISESTSFPRPITCTLTKREVDTPPPSVQVQEVEVQFPRGNGTVEAGHQDYDTLKDRQSPNGSEFEDSADIVYRLSIPSTHQGKSGS